VSATLDAAIAAHAAHAAMGCDDLLTNSLVDQCTYAEGQHPIQLQADDDLRLPAWWPWFASAVLAVTWLFSYIQPWGFAR
jgi:hypothetical protein